MAPRVAEVSQSSDVQPAVEHGGSSQNESLVRASFQPCLAQLPSKAWSKPGEWVHHWFNKIWKRSKPSLDDGQKLRVLQRNHLGIQ